MASLPHAHLHLQFCYMHYFRASERLEQCNASTLLPFWLCPMRVEICSLLTHLSPPSKDLQFSHQCQVTPGSWCAGQRLKRTICDVQLEFASSSRCVGHCVGAVIIVNDQAFDAVGPSQSHCKDVSSTQPLVAQLIFRLRAIITSDRGLPYRRSAI